ncbi:MAG: M48 family metalloprotease [Saprospiraceae bacterium]
MCNGKHRPVWLAPLLFITLVLLSTGCRGDLPDLAAKENFPKAKLEHLGDKLLLEMLATYQFLPDIPPYDTTVYWYLRTLYGQATNTMHRDRQSPSVNRWDKERPWRVFVIKNDTLQHAFTLPGGDFLITTGLLKNLNTDHEIYALLTFEADLMHQGHQLERMIEQYNALTLENIADGNPTANDMTAETLAAEFLFLSYDFRTVENIDEETVTSVCESSILDPAGIAAVAAKAGLQGSLWLQTRPSYGGRASVLASFAEQQETPCGNQTGTANYQRFVLNVLD